MLAIATNIPVLLMTAFVLQAHISKYYKSDVLELGYAIHIQNKIKHVTPVYCDMNGFSD